LQSSNNKKGSRPRHIVPGLSVLEMLIILAAVAIVVLISVPGSTLLLEKYRLKTTEKSLLISLELAKVEAQRRSSTVIVCPSSNGHSCRRDQDWNYGWVVFSDGNGNGTVQDIELIDSVTAPHGRIRIEAKGATKSRASFTMTGLLSEHDASTGEFKICINGSGAAPRLIAVEPDGWVKLVPPENENCEFDQVPKKT
jgi:type IV fimbrial biogenesis protein FimT